MLLFFTFSYSSSLLSVSPFEKLFLSLGLMILSLQTSLTILAFFIFIFMSVLVIGIGFPIASFFRLFLLSYSFVLLGIIPIVLEIGVFNDLGIFLWHLELGEYTVGISLFSLKSGIHILTRSISSLFCLYFLILTTPFLDIVILMKRLRFPSFILEVFVLLHRFFIIMFGVLGKTIVSQRSRLGYSGYLVSFRSFVALVVSLFDNSFRAVQRFFQSLEARSYGGEFPLFERDYSFSIPRVLAIGCLFLLLASFDFYFSK